MADQVARQNPLPRPYAPAPDQSAFKGGFGKRGKQKAKCPSPPSKSPIQTRLFLPDTFVSPRAKGFEKSFDASSGSIILTNWEEQANGPELFETRFCNRIKIGSGDFADVWRCQDSESGQWSAVKRTRRTFRGAQDRQSAIGEAEALAQVGEHRNIINYHRVWEERGRTYIQMELYEKTLQQSLDELDQRGERVPEHQIWESILDLSLGLYHIHQQGLLHLDLKPENIFVSKQGLLVIGDFGNAVRNGEWTGDSDGTNKYMAMETLNGPVSYPADICSLGFVILEMALLKDLPSGGDLWHALRENSEPHFPSHMYSAELRTLVSRLTDRHPLRRPSAANILEHPRIAELLTKKGINVQTAGRRPNALESPFKRSRSLEDLASETPFFDAASTPRIDFSSSDLLFDPESPSETFPDLSPIPHAVTEKKRSPVLELSASKRSRIPVPNFEVRVRSLKRCDSREFVPRSHPGKLQAFHPEVEGEEEVFRNPLRRNLMKEFLRD